MAAQEFEHEADPVRGVETPREGGPAERGQTSPVHFTDMEARVEHLSRKLRALEMRVVESREASERIQERLIQTLEMLDSRISSGRQAATAKLESLLNSVAAGINDVKGVVRTEAKNTEETLWRGLSQLEARLSQSGGETQHRLARAVAMLSIAADEWRAATPALGAKAEETVVERLLALDAAVSRGSQSISQYLEKSLLQLAESIKSWQAELETSTKESSERLSSGLGSLEKRLNDQMRDLEARIQERQMAMITLIIGGGGVAAPDLTEERSGEEFLSPKVSKEPELEPEPEPEQEQEPEPPPMIKRSRPTMIVRKPSV